MDALSILSGTVKHYDWGGYTFIPSLLNVSNYEQKPFAEYWLGVHPQAENLAIQSDRSVILLRDYFSTKPSVALGEEVAKRFDNLPYLVKVLDVKDMLSIQVHPSKAQAEIDFLEENKKGIPLDSPLRNYKDKNHKPELMVAIGDFWLLHGFKPEKEISTTLQSIPELRGLLSVFEKESYRGLYKKIMEMPQAHVNLQLEPLIDRLIPLYKDGKLKKSDAGYWAAKAAISFSKPGKADRGIYSIFLFNLVALHSGDAIFQDAGVPHAYLEGQNVEIMASSDNVLRGGLTTKHIDVAELLKHIKCEATYPRIDKGEKHGAEFIYKTPAPDFQLSSFVLNEDEEVSFTTGTAEVMLLISGEVKVSNDNGTVTLKKGQPSAIAVAGQTINIVAKQRSWLFKSTVPAHGIDK